MGLNVHDPLILLPRLQRQDLRVRLDDGNGGFDLMAGVRDEAFLLFMSLDHRLNDPPGQQQKQQKHRQQPRRRHPEAGHQRAVKGKQVGAVVQENHPRVLPLPRLQIPVVLPKSPWTVLGPDGLGIAGRGLLIHCGDLSGVRGQNCSLPVQEHGKISGLIAQLHGPVPGAQFLPVEIRFDLWKLALVVRQQVQDAVRVRDNSPVVGQENYP